MESKPLYMQGLTVAKLRILVDWVYDGEKHVAGYLFQIKEHYPKRNVEILMWLRRNGIRGKKVLEFFHNERDTDIGMSTVNGVVKILNSIDQTKKYVKEVKI